MRPVDRQGASRPSAPRRPGRSCRPGRGCRPGPEAGRRPSRRRSPGRRSPTTACHRPRRWPATAGHPVVVADGRLPVVGRGRMAVCRRAVSRRRPAVPRADPPSPTRPCSSGSTTATDGLHRLRPHGAQPPRRQPAAAVHAAPAPAGRAPADRPGRRGHRADRRPGRQDRRAAAARATRSWPPTSRASGPSWPGSSTSRPAAGAARALLVDNADWLGRCRPGRLPARRGQALHRQPDGGQGVGAGPLRAGRPGHLLHRVQLHAAAGLRLPPAPRATTAATLQVGGSDQWGNITMGVELIRKVRRTRGLRPDHAAGDQGRRHQVRQDRVRAPSGSTRPAPAPTGSTSSSCRPRTRWSAPTCGTSPSSPTTRSTPSTPRRRPTPSAGPPSGPWPARWCSLVHGPEESERAERASTRPVRRGRRRARRADAGSRCSRTRPTSRRAAGRPRRRAAARGRAGATGLASSQGRGPPGHRARAGVYVNNRRRARRRRRSRPRRPAARTLRGAAPGPPRLPPADRRVRLVVCSRATPGTAPGRRRR